MTSSLYVDFRNPSSGWRTVTVRNLLTFQKQEVGIDWDTTQLLSLTKQGVITRDIDSGVGKYPASFENYQKVMPDDIVFCLFDVEETPRTVGLVKQEGMITSAYTRAVLNQELINPRFAEYLFISWDNEKRFKPYYSGLRNTIPKETLRGTRLSLPQLDEQELIADYLDSELKQIAILIERQQALIAGLKERRERVIWAEVTQASNEVREISGNTFDWQKIIPESWKVKPLWTVTSFTTGWTPPSGNDDFYSDEFPWVNISDLGPYFVETTAKGLSTLATKSLRLKKTLSGQLMFSFKLSIGQVSFAGIDCYTNEAIASFRESPELNLSYAFYMLPICVPENASENIYGAKMLNAQRIKNARLIIPSLKEQERIANSLQEATFKIDTLISKAEAVISSLRLRQESLIESAVSGKRKRK
jgi:type I restriction enzyme S subunit